MAVLKREDENRSSASVAMSDVHTILGPESRFQGTLSFEGTVRIDGNFKGDINTSDVLVVGQGALVEAEIKCGSIVINGEVRGNITAKTAVEIHAPGKVRGNITTPVLVIDRGVIFEGNAKMDNLDAAKIA
ncbi:MAG: polymer-forming cytoskeletal protein [Deltaproteobacteria bacterium]|nr:polymer-forming cytoskeletal protein [Deltaproteobacteria bacterium]